MTKEKKTFAWDTILLIKEAGGPMFVRGTDIEVEWCPVTQMFWEVQTMTTLCATGKSNLDDVTPMYLWAYGNYRYEIEVKKNSYFSDSEVFETSYEDALKKFENMVDKAVLV